MRALTGTWRAWAPSADPTSLTIGVLDGVHRGHRALIGRLRPDGLATVLTFDPHPMEVLRPATPPRLITTIDERLALFEQVGVDLVGVLDLAEIRELGATEFVEGILVGTMNISSLTVGPDFRFGKDRRGDVDLLLSLGAKHGFGIDVIELVADDGEPVSSSRIRTLIEAGDVAAASVLLESRFRLTNVVVDGDKRGAGIGFPTANLLPPKRKVIPGAGVYAAIAHLGRAAHMAAVNVGVRPTFGGGGLVIEAYLLDFEADIYGAELTLEFVERLRPELRFDTVEELIDRMRLDVAETREVLAAAGPFVG